MADLPSWTIILRDRATGNAVGEFIQYANASYTKRLNSAGSAAATISLDDPICYLIEPLATVLEFRRNGALVWSGPIVSREDNMPSRSVTIQATGYFDVLNHRVLREERVVFTDVDAGQIAAALLSKTNTNSPTGISLASVETTATRTRTYKRFASVGGIISDLSQIENGFDFEVLGTEMRIFRQQGIDRSASAARGVNQTVLGYQAAKQNIANFSRRIDTSKFTNRLSVVTIASTEIVQDSDSVAEYGLYETTEDIAQVSADVGRAYAAAEVAVRGLPIETIDVALIPADEDERAPRFDGNAVTDTHFFGLGDKVRVIIQDPAFPLIDQAFRVFGATLSLDSNGSERVTSLQLAAPLRTKISTVGMIFRDSGGVFTPTMAGNPTSPVRIDRVGYYVESQPYINPPVGQTWIVGDPTYSILGMTTILS